MVTQELCILRGEDIENYDVQNNGDNSEESEIEDANNSDWFLEGSVVPKNTYESDIIRNTINDEDRNKVNLSLINIEREIAHAIYFLMFVLGFTSLSKTYSFVYFFLIARQLK